MTIFIYFSSWGSYVLITLTFPPPPRNVVATAVDFNLNTLKIKIGIIILKKIFFIDLRGKENC